MNLNEYGMALDAWTLSIPDDVYEPCPCGCGEKFRYVVKDESKLQEHEKRFIQKYLDSKNN